MHMMIKRAHIVASIALAAVPCAARPAAHTTIAATDASWVRSYAGPAEALPTTAHAPDVQGRENALLWDARFLPLLRSSFPQHQWFWRDHGEFTPLPDLIRTFMGVPGSALLDKDRYVTASGCVPHDCGDKGMLWIDTGSEPARLVFAATGIVNEGPQRASLPARDHLWLFCSRPLNWQKLPLELLSSIRRWNDRTAMAFGPQPFILVTIVQPTGEIVDLAPALLQLSEPGAKQ
jgi:hypothetical protein